MNEFVAKKSFNFIWKERKLLKIFRLQIIKVVNSNAITEKYFIELYSPFINSIKTDLTIYFETKKSVRVFLDSIKE